MPTRRFSNLTDTQARNAKPKEKPYKLTDGGGLYLFVSPAGGKLWRMKYYFDRSEKLLSLGPYPALSIAEARKRLTEAREQIANGIDPGVHKKAVRAAERAINENSYEVIAREWITKHYTIWAASHETKIIARQENDIFPHIGGRPVNKITAPELLAVLRMIEQRGALDTAHRALQDCSRIFRYAIATGRAERDPAADLRGALSPAKEGHFATITEPKAIGDLLRAIDAYGGSGGSVIVAAALRLAPYVFVRPGELRRAEWKEFDFEKMEWRIPAEKMKMRQTHIVPLSRQVLEILHDLKPHTGHGVYLFPSLRTDTRPISDVALLAALRRLGFAKEEMTIHGFRSMASTLLNEQGYNRDWIERQLAHGERNNVRAAYNYAEYMPERRRMMQQWADYLDRLRK